MILKNSQEFSRIPKGTQGNQREPKGREKQWPKVFFWVEAGEEEEEEDEEEGEETYS